MVRVLASDGFIREVDEELQRDRMAMLWKRFGPVVVALASLLVLATAGKVAWDAWQARQLEQQGAAFAEAEATLGGDDPVAAAAQFASLADAQSGDSSAIARLREADARLASDDTEAALTLLDRVASTEGIDPIFRDFAAVAAAQRHVSNGGSERARDLLATRAGPDSPFHHSARELAAVAALQAGSVLDATELLLELRADTLTPVDLRQRVEELLALLGVTEEGLSSDARMSDNES